MAVDERDLSEFAQQMAPLGPVRYKKMFGGAGFWIGEHMFAIYAEGSFMFRADAVNAPQFTARGIGPWEPGMMKPRNGRVVSMPYYAIPDEVMSDPQLLLQWGQEAAAAADRMPPSKKKR